MASRYRINIGTSDGSIIATIITVHMPTNDAAAPSQVSPHVGIHVIDIDQPPGIGISPMDDIDSDHMTVVTALAANSSAAAPNSAACDVRTEDMSASFVSYECGVLHIVAHRQ